jgi:hypothetical protein
VSPWLVPVNPLRGMSAAWIRLLAIVLVVTIGSPAAAAFAKSGPIIF